MKVIVFGATGMVGQGVFRECLLAPDVERVLSVGRTPTGRRESNLTELVHGDFTNFSGVRTQLTGYDACFFCLGTSSAGMSESDYTRVTYDFAMAAAHILVAVNPAMTFVFVSGSGADSTEHGRVMWARVKGKTENALLKLGFKAAYIFRPGYIQPMHGVVGKTRWIRAFLAISSPFYPLLRVVLPTFVSSTDRIGQAMLEVAAHGAPAPILETLEINRLAALRMKA